MDGCPDARLTALLRGARALLMPSFYEGYCMPVAEALLGGGRTPVIASDLAALHEVGGEVSDFLDHAGRDFLHAAQMARLPHWHDPIWAEHIAFMAEAIEG